jgi:hypothetical protein
LEQQQTTPAMPEVSTGLTTEQAAQSLLARWNSRQQSADADDSESEAPEATDDGEEPRAEQSREDNADARDDEPEAQEVESTEYELEFAGSKFKLKPEDLPAKFGELQAKAKELEGGATRKFQEAAELRKSLEAEREQIQQLGRIATQHTELLADMRSTQREIEQLQGVDWNALSDSDPVTAQKAMARLMTLQNVQQRIGAQIQDARMQMQQSDVQMRQQWAQRGTERLSQLIPNINDATKKELAEFIGQRDLTPMGKEALWDPEVVAAFHDAMKYRAMKQAAPAEKRAVDAPKTLRPGTAATPITGQKQRVDEARKRLRQTGKTDDLVSLLLAKSRR